MNGKQIIKMAENMFGTRDITSEQLAYIIDMLKPSTYALRNHTTKNGPMTFSIPSDQRDRALQHRPWQVD